MLVHTYYCHSHLGIKQYLKFKFTFKLPLNCVNISNSGNTFKPKFNPLLNIDRTGVLRIVDGSRKPEKMAVSHGQSGPSCRNYAGPSIRCGSTEHHWQEYYMGDRFAWPI